MPKKVITAEDVSQFIRSNRYTNRTVAKGYELYWRDCTELAEYENDYAEILVIGKGRKMSEVQIDLVDGAVQIRCSCGKDGEDLCEHGAAACFALENYLKQHPPFVWQAVLTSVMQAPQARQDKARNDRVLVFNLRLYPDGGAFLNPYLVRSKELPEELPEDAAELARYLHAHRADWEAHCLYSRSGINKARNASGPVLAAANLLLSSIYYGTDAFKELLPQLPHCPLFLETEEYPLAVPLSIEPARASLSLFTEHDADGVRLTLNLRRAGAAAPEPLSDFHILSRQPLWILVGQTILPVEESAALLELFQKHPELLIPEEDTTEFITDFLTPLAERMPVEGAFAPTDDVRADAVKRVYLAEDEGDLVARLRFGYGEHEVPYQPSLPSTSVTGTPGENLVRVYRQPEVEEAAWKELFHYGLKRGTRPGECILRKQVTAVDFLIRQVPRLVEAGYQIFGEEALTTARVNRNRPTLSLDVSSGIDWFDVQAVVHFGELDVAWSEVLKSLRRRERYIKLADGTIGMLPDDWVARYQRVLGLVEEGDGEMRLAAHQITVLEELLDTADNARVDEEFARRRERLRNLKGIDAQPLPQEFQGELRSYQKAGFDWLHFLHEYGFGGCLADDMGTGKTIQALVFLQSLKERGEAKNASLIVAPRSLIFNWEREAAQFTPKLRVAIHADGQREQTAENFNDYDVILTTYGVMLRDIEWLRSYRFHYLILDESQAIKNPAALTARAARHLNGDHRLVLTGTPVENTTLELWSQFAFLNPGLLGGFDNFRKEFALPIERQHDEAAAQQLRRMVFPFILRRTKEQVAADLPPRTERIVYCDMEPAQRKSYTKSRDYYRALLLGLIEEEGMDKARMKVLEGLLRLRQICNHPQLVDPGFRGASGKFTELLEMLESLQAGGHKALVFSQFTQMLKLVREALDVRNVPYVYLDGKTRDRAARVDLFQEDPQIPFFLISLKAGGVGLNLTAADYVIHIDPWWNPAVEMQAADRAHRIGQDKPVFVYRMIVRGSVEEKILQLQASKRELVSQLIQTDSSVFKSLNRSDVEILFS